ncbi:MAG: Smr/MutS family protein [Patescibacteria group bacterium]
MAEKRKKEKKQKYPVKQKNLPRISGEDWGALDMIEPDSTLDLHGDYKIDAEVKVDSFIQEAQRRGYKKVRIITGSGSHSVDNLSVLRPAVASYLDKLDLPYKNAGAWQGGEGAIDIKLV